MEAPKAEEVSSKPEEVAPPKEDKFNETFQRIAKQERHLSEERKKIEEARKAFEQDRADVEAYRNLKKLKDADPFEVLNQLGLSYDQLTQLAIEKAKPSDPLAKKALEEVQKLQNELQSAKQKEQQERFAKAELQLMTEITKVAKESEYDVIEKLGAHSTVREYMEEMYAQTGEIPNIKDACQAVTDHIASLYQKISDSKWVKPKEEPKPVAKEPVPAKESLSNKLTQTTAFHDKPLTEAERLKAAARAMEMIGK